MNGVLQILRTQLRRVTYGELPPHVLNVGLTGGIGSGKSTVAGILQSHGVPVIDMDRISHELTQAGGRALAPIQAHFGSRAIAVDGALNRAFIRDRVFADPSERVALENILHPMIAQEVITRAHTLAHLGHLVVVYDIPLLVESETWQKRLDWIVVVDCDPDVQIQRVLNRNPNLELKTVQSIIAAQASSDQRRQIANALIDNRQNLSNRLNLVRQVAILTNYMSVLSTQKQYN